MEERSGYGLYDSDDSIMGGYSTFVSRQSQGKIKHRSVDCMLLGLENSVYNNKDKY